MDRRLSEWVRSRRELLGLSQRELAARVGVTQPMISAIEAGRRAPTPQVRAAIEEALTLQPSVAARRRRDDIAAAVRRHGGLSVMVTGSTALGTDRPGSDLDLLVEFEPDRDILDLLALEEELSELLTIEVDVVSAGSDGRVIESARLTAVPL
jgi:predicted nucleotidyltransferase